MATYQEILTAAQGTYINNTTLQYDGSFDGFYVLEDTIIFKLSDKDGKVVTDYIKDSSIAIKAGAFIRPQNGSQFNSIKLSSGSVILIL